jgi:hypothetical protein
MLIFLFNFFCRLTRCNLHVEVGNAINGLVPSALSDVNDKAGLRWPPWKVGSDTGFGSLRVPFKI